MLEIFSPLRAKDVSGRKLVVQMDHNVNVDFTQFRAAINLKSIRSIAACCVAPHTSADMQIIVQYPCDHAVALVLEWSPVCGILTH